MLRLEGNVILEVCKQTVCILLLEVYKHTVVLEVFKQQYML